MSPCVCSLGKHTHTCTHTYTCTHTITYTNIHIYTHYHRCRNWKVNLSMSVCLCVSRGVDYYISLKSHWLKFGWGCLLSSLEETDLGGDMTVNLRDQPTPDSITQHWLVSILLSEYSTLISWMSIPSLIISFDIKKVNLSGNFSHPKCVIFFNCLSLYVQDS